MILRACCLSPVRYLPFWVITFSHWEAPASPFPFFALPLPFPFPCPSPAAWVLYAAPEQDLHLYAVFRMSSLYGETKQVHII
ncbi:unnamed protein product [Penicillium camemberti]|uniref:Str. FM013 n=1 Tax=Penicillium camemberti (strain FM 013) TaxID=1429867 RepID=A0A0G4PGQ0_PENC3|nr:unnamed protein product [Penicillium camemberti]